MQNKGWKSFVHLNYMYTGLAFLLTLDKPYLLIDNGTTFVNLIFKKPVNATVSD